MASKPQKSTRQKSTQNLPTEGKFNSAAPKGSQDLGVVAEYEKYFTAPQMTPPGFHILDLTDGGSVNTTSHT